MSNVADAGCIYHQNTAEEPYGGCLLYKEASGVISEDKLLTLTAEERSLFDDTCYNWPLPFVNPDYAKVYTDAEKRASAEFESVCCHRWEQV